MSTFLFKLGHFASRHPWRVIGAWLVLACATFALNAQFGGEAERRLPAARRRVPAGGRPARGEVPGAEPLHQPGRLQRRRGGSPDRRPERWSPRPSTELAALPHVVAVSDPYDAASPMLSPDGRMGFATVTFDTGDVELVPLDEAEAAVAPMRDAGLTVEYSGLLGLRRRARRAEERADRHGRRRGRAGPRLRLAGGDEPARSASR